MRLVLSPPGDPGAEAPTDAVHSGSSAAGSSRATVAVFNAYALGDLWQGLYIAACCAPFARVEFCARDYEPASATVAIASSSVHQARAAEVVDGRSPRALRPRTNDIVSLASNRGFVARSWRPSLEILASWV